MRMVDLEMKMICDWQVWGKEILLFSSSMAVLPVIKIQQASLLTHQLEACEEDVCPQACLTLERIFCSNFVEHRTLHLAWV